jgi:hypothetical protein
LPVKDDKGTFSFKTLSLGEIYKLITNHIARFRDEKDNLQSFISWIKKHNPAFVSVATKRLRVKDDQKNVIQAKKRSMYVLNEKY